MDSNPHHYGENLRRLRLTMKLTMRQLAQLAGLNKDTIYRIENGGTASTRTKLAISNVFKMDATAMDQLIASKESHVINKATNYQWHAHDCHVPVDINRIQEESERLRLGRLGAVARFEQVAIHGQLLNGSRCSSAAHLEIWKRSDAPSVHSGYEYCHCLRGAVRVFIGEEIIELHEGDSVIFRSHFPHDYEPLHPPSGHDLPPVVLYLKILE